MDFEGINQGDQDFTAVLLKIKTKYPDIIYFGGMYPEGALLAKQIRQVGFPAPTSLMGADGLYAPEFISLARDAADGTIISLWLLPLTGSKQPRVS